MERTGGSEDFLDYAFYSCGISHFDDITVAGAFLAVTICPKELFDAVMLGIIGTNRIGGSCAMEKTGSERLHR